VIKVSFKVTSQANRSWKRNSWKDKSSDNCRKLEGMVQTWRCVVVHSMAICKAHAIF